MATNILLLLVENEPLIQTLLDDALTEAGFALVMAKDGTTALAELEADAARYRALITDIRLGTGPDGWAVARHAASASPRCPSST